MAFGSKFAAQRLQSILTEVFALSFPLFEFARTGWLAAGPTAAEPEGRYNQFLHRRRLTDPTQRAITATNNDCLVSNARIDLSRGPLKLSVPDIHGRYFSVAFMDAFTDNFRFVGTRATGGRGGEFLLCPPGWEGAVPHGLEPIVAPSNDIWLLVRILVEGPDDVAVVNGLQDGLTISPVNGDGQPQLLSVVPAEGRDPANLLAVASAMLARIPDTDHRVRRAKLQRPLGLARGSADPFSRVSPKVRKRWTDELPGMLAALAKPQTGLARVRDGWSYSAASIGAFGADDLLRAQIALIGLAALPPEEAFYGQALADSAGAQLDGTHAYRLRIPPGGPPVDAFWSLTMYQVESDGRLFLSTNAINRYSIGDRTHGLKFGSDGSLDILMQHEAPVGAFVSNWLPVPRGAFRPAFRGYLARPELRQLIWRLPAIERIA